MRKLGLVLVATMAAVMLGAAPAQAAGGVIIYRAYYNSPGSDTGTNYSLNGEWIQIRNTAPTAKFIHGWTLRDRQNHVYKFPTTRINPGQIITVRTGKGTNNAANRYQQRAWYVWNNTGDAAYLRTPKGVLVDSCAWGSTGSSRYC